MKAVRALLSGLIDYAGLFPPAGVSMAQAIENFAAYHRSPESWMLGRFVVPAKRLGEFGAAFDALPAADRGKRWELSVLLGADLEGDLREVAAFESYPRMEAPAITAFETPTDSPERIEQLRALCPRSAELFIELPLSGDLPTLAAAVARARASAKMRTGGLKAEDFANPSALLAFLEACAAARVPWKATAGLHHPVRGDAPVTYEPGSPCAKMYGYLNVFLAATALWSGRPAAEALRLLGREDRSDLMFQAESITWGGVCLAAEEITEARRDFCRSIGSCSFTEPLEEIRALGADLEYLQEEEKA